MEGYVARQAIYDRDKRVAAYELLYRGGSAALTAEGCGAGSSEEVMSNGFFSIGWKTLVGDRPALWNVGQELLMSDKILVLPPERVYLEILENTKATVEVLNRCRDLKARGFRLVLDDYTGQLDKSTLLDLCHWVKVDWLGCSLEVKRRAPRAGKRKYLAEKVETQGDLVLAMNLGYDYFQGYVLERPRVMSGRRLPAAQLNRLRLLSELGKPEPGIRQIEAAVSRDLDLTYKLMTWVNSAASGRRNPVSSVREALLWMGLERVRRFVGMFAISGLNSSGNAELLQAALIRARMSDQVTSAVGAEQERSKAFLGGLLSMLEAMLAKPMDEICEEMGLPDELRDLFEAGGCSPCCMAKRSLRVATAWQEGEKQAAKVVAAETHLSPADLSKIYLDSIVWAHDSNLA
ncbi:MAG TPA: HDOD domain-containing protein [Bryobacteraceae bacterium]|nr:HDOD domain-containing protein [Bryobacteraceae bacterium]HPT26039.1 HDOD domain-containing protein [Bryobacteraceae bacterium]